MTVAELSLPRGWDDITPDWMTAALARHDPDAVVDGVAVALRDDGTNRRARLALTYSSRSPAVCTTSRDCSPPVSNCPSITRPSTRR